MKKPKQTQADKQKPQQQQKSQHQKTCRGKELKPSA